MAAPSCPPGCRLCLRAQGAACPFCLGDWACDQCWQDVQDQLEHVEHDEWLEHMQGVLYWGGAEGLQSDDEAENAGVEGLLSDDEGVDAAALGVDWGEEIVSSTDVPDSDDVVDEFAESSAVGSDEDSAGGGAQPQSRSRSMSRSRR